MSRTHSDYALQRVQCLHWLSGTWRLHFLKSVTEFPKVLSTSIGSRYATVLPVPGDHTPFYKFIILFKQHFLWFINILCCEASFRVLNIISMNKIPIYDFLVTRVFHYPLIYLFSHFIPMHGCLACFCLFLCLLLYFYFIFWANYCDFYVKIK